MFIFIQSVESIEWKINALMTSSCDLLHWLSFNITNEWISCVHCMCACKRYRMQTKTLNNNRTNQSGGILFLWIWLLCCFEKSNVQHTWSEPYCMHHLDFILWFSLSWAPFLVDALGSRDVRVCVFYILPLLTSSMNWMALMRCYVATAYAAVAVAVSVAMDVTARNHIINTENKSKDNQNNNQ